MHAPQNWSRVKTSSFGLRVALLTALLLLPMVLLAFYLAHLVRQQELEHIRSESRTVARAIATHQGAGLRQVREQLALLASGETGPGPGADCAQYLKRVAGMHTTFFQLAYTDAEGRIVCSAKPVSANLHLGDRAYFMRAVADKRFALSEVLQSRDTRTWTMVAAQPVLDQDRVRGVLVAALDLKWAQEAMTSLRLPPGAIISMSDGQGKIVARMPEPEKYIGKPVLEAEQFSRAVAEHREGYMESAGLDGVPRIIAWSQVPDTGLYVRVGIPRTEVEAAGRHVLQAMFLVIAAVLGFTLLVGWQGARRLVLQPIRRLTEAADRLGHGNWAARTGLPHQSDAMGRLARKLDELAEHAQRITRAYKTLSAGNRTLLRENEESELLTAMCRVAVERGGYVLAYVSYLHHDEAKSVTVAAHYGKSDGYVENLQMSWDEASERGRSTVSEAIRTNVHSFIRDIAADARLAPWHAVAREHGFGAVISLPLRIDDAAVGAFTLIAAESGSFDEEEVALLDEMAADLSFGIQTIQGHARRVEAERIASHALTHDNLTQLPNRVLFLQGIETAIEGARAAHDSVAVLIVHLVRLQEIVDGFGHDPGLGVIREVALRLARVEAAGATLARIQVDEFGIFLPACNPRRATQAAEQMLAAFEEPVRIGAAQIDVSATVGVSFYPGHGGDAEALLRRAAIAARDGMSKDRSYSVYRGATERENPARLALAAELRSAITKRELALHYQAKIDIASGKLAGSEALVRWPHPTRGLIPPVQFVPLAEETGLIRPMTAHIVEAAIRQQHMWMKAGHALPVAVNLSVRNLYDPHFLEALETLLETWGVPATLIDFEITEGALVDDPDTAKRVLTRLRQLGSKTSIDDFGTGYSSLNYLVSLPVHALKIDQSFVKQMSKSPEAHSVVASIVSMAHNLGLEVVAEGVETEADLAMLASLGCDKAQGYYISKPIAAADFETSFLKAGSAGIG